MQESMSPKCSLTLERRVDMYNYDFVFIGHITIDDIEAEEGSARGVPGGAPLFGAFAASCSRKRIAVVTRMAKEDEGYLASLKAAGIDVYLQPADHTTHMRVVHPTANVDERLMYQTENAGFFSLEDLPPLGPCPAHLGALTDREFTLGFMRGLKERGFRLSVDMQNFVRQVDIGTGVIYFRDVPAKKEIARIVDMVKLDVVEAEILTGAADPEQAAVIVEKWGCPEIIVTRSDGVLARYKGKTYYERFSHRNSQGRTGRGDTTTGSYLVRRLDHGVEDSLKFAAALASIKMETSGPFRGTLEDVLGRMGS
jgi:sugar/nucleoside kinase (ribokinase family)